MKYILSLTIPLFILDQLTKAWILKIFPTPPYVPIEVIPGFFNLTRVHNTGMAFGLLNGNPYSNYIFGTFGLIAFAVIVVLWRRNAFPDALTKSAVALLIAGIFGNLTDRIIPGRGYVVDFLDFILPFWHLFDRESHGHFPSFNVADSCICIAAALMFLSAWQGIRQEAAAKKAK
jgi:signal peptidase II